MTRNRTISVFSLEKGAGNRIFIITLRCVILSDRPHRYQITKRRTWLNYYVKIDTKPVEPVKPLKNSMLRYLNKWDYPGFRFVHGFGLGSSKSGSYTQDCDKREDLDLVLENTGYRARILPRLRKKQCLLH